MLRVGTGRLVSGSHHLFCKHLVIRVVSCPLKYCLWLLSLKAAAQTTWPTKPTSAVFLLPNPRSRAEPALRMNIEGKKIRNSGMEPSQNHNTGFQPKGPLGSDDLCYCHHVEHRLHSRHLADKRFTCYNILPSVVLLFQFYR